MAGKSTQGRIARGLELALRSGAAPIAIGARLLARNRWQPLAELPTPRAGLAATSKVILDELFFASEFITARFVSPRESQRLVAEVEGALKLFEERGWLAAPESYHLAPPAIDTMCMKDVPASWLQYRHLSFASEYEPHLGEPGRERWLANQANRTAHAWVYEHPGSPRPWIVCIPGYRMGHPLVDSTGFRVRWLHKTLGLNVAILVLPLHGPRALGRRGGDGFLSGDFIDTLHAQTQAVWDVRRLIRWLRAERAPAVGIYGVSLGGYTAALVASLDDRIDCVVAGIPAADLLRLIRSHAPQFLLSTAERAGFDFGKLEQVLRVVSPLVIPPRVPRARRFVYAGLFDRLTSPDHARDLWKHWGKPRAAWYQGGHVSFLWQPEVKALLEEAFRSCGLVSDAS